MSKKLFICDDIEILSKNKYVKKVSEKGIAYTDECNIKELKHLKVLLIK